LADEVNILPTRRASGGGDRRRQRQEARMAVVFRQDATRRAGEPTWLSMRLSLLWSSARGVTWLLLVLALVLIGCTSPTTDASASRSAASDVGAVRQALCGAGECSICRSCHADGATCSSNSVKACLG